MPKPLKETFLSRIWRLFVGVVFYNTVYWRRASDGLNPPKLSHDERQQRRPVRDINKIRPRSHPRARLDAQESSTTDVSVPRLSDAPLNLPPAAEPLPPRDEHSPGRIRKKKRKKHLRMRSDNIFSRWFG